MFKIFIVLILFLTGCTGVSQLEPLQTTEEGVTLPENYRETFIHYLTVDRADGVARDIYIRPEAVDALRVGGKLPDNTVIVIEAYQADRGDDKKYHVDDSGHLVPDHPLEMIHVMEKRSTWTADDFPTANRSGNWNFGTFDFTTGEPFDEDLGQCFNCHNTTPGTDFVYTRPLLQQYIITGKTQYTYCNLSGRIAC